ncbi:MAG: hypothetical protein L3J63_08040 [Geopsychrobacter sp.]|nr:hypothetical protein [Geopsychrobacter sp.]
MSSRPLKRSLEYKARVRDYARGLAQRYRPEISDVFLKSITSAEKRIADNNNAGTDAPYTMLDQNIILKELHFKSGPVSYCLIYDIMDDYVGLISLWHSVGQRSSDLLSRVWRRSDWPIEK